ncbi:MAG TPA: DNA polymerase III subunit alpha [Jatrophihabitans sp.]
MTAGGADSFVHLHVHTEYSMLDGASLLDGLFTRVSELGMSAIAMTDHGNLHGAFDFWSKARKHGVKPIIGLEAYLTPGTSRFEKRRTRWGRGDSEEEGGNDVAGGGAYTHMTMLAETTEGMQNLFRLSSLSSLEGYYYNPRADREILSQYAKGLIATTGCPSGAIQTRLRLGQYDEARREAGELQDIFGKESFFLELMDHGINIEKVVRDDLLRLGKELDIRPVATNDSHYNNPGDADAHDALICVASGKRLSDTKRLKFAGGGYYIKSPAEMRDLWDGTWGMREACDNTLLIAERCQVEFQESTGGYMARADVPAGQSEESWFVAEVWRGITARYGEKLAPEVVARTEMELEVIKTKGYCGYYLVVADFINWAKDNGVRVGPGRGSGAGSIAAYALRITDLDPLRHGLIFERFLNPERPSMPDFDIDFDDRRRGDVINYVSEKYGSERVAQIATFGRLKAKAAIKDAARVLDYDFKMGDTITKALPPDVMGKGIKLKELFDPSSDRYNEGKEFRDLHESNPDVQRIYDTARGLEGQIRNWGVHAAGVIMSSEPLIDIVPIMKREQDGAIITQFDYPMCEALGLVKMDFLGLRNLTVLDDALANIKNNRGVELVLEDLEYDDEGAYELLARGDTLGVFQLDGGPMRSLLRQMQPDNFEDISAVIALYRPGPMGANSHINYALRKTGKQDIDYIHPELTEALEPILGGTYGLIVYQEQVMSIAQELAGYTLGQADNLRRAMGKKKREVLEKEFEGFQTGMRARKYSDVAIKTLWEILVPFADYAFNKAHSASYGVISYWTAFLKAHYPAEYMAALLTSVKDDKDKMAVYLAECRQMGIKVLPPSVNHSDADFTPTGGDIRFGLTAIRNVGANVVTSIVATRKSKGRFTDLGDFLDKVEAVVCNKRTFESLIKGGAFDELGHSRRGLIQIYEQALDTVVDVKRAEAIGQFDLFGSLGDDVTAANDVFAVRVPEGEWDKKVLLGFEREMLGLYVSDHPLFGLEHLLGKHADTTIATVHAEGAGDGQMVTMAGLVASVNRRITKDGASWAQVVLEDLEGSIEVMFFPASYAKVGMTIAEDTVVSVRGRLDARDDTVKIIGSELTILDTTDTGHGPVKLKLEANKCTPPLIERLRDVLGTHPGMTEVHLHLVSTNSPRMVLDLRVEPSAALMGDLKALLGPAAVSA